MAGRSGGRGNSSAATGTDGVLSDETGEILPVWVEESPCGALVAWRRTCWQSSALSRQVATRARGADGSSLDIRGDSDALIVKGLVALVIAMFNGRTISEIAAFDAQAFFGEIGLKDHLTAQRSNGLASMVARIKAEAAKG